MTHEDAGHYARKHGGGGRPRPEVAAAVQRKASEATISCSAAHRIAVDLGLPPGEIGRNIDLLEVRMVKCQLGLYGHGPEKKAVKPAETVSGELERAIREALVEGRLSCAAAWGIADRLAVGRMDVASACEALKVKISSCQLGAF